MKEQQKKQRESNKEVKEYRLSVNMDIGDFNTRKKNALDYLNKGHKIKATLQKSIEIIKKQLNYTQLKNIMYEKELIIEINKELNIRLKGYIDKIMCENAGTYVAHDRDCRKFEKM